MRHHNHMIGLVLLTPDDTDDNVNFSFRLTPADGIVTDLGWGSTGPEYEIPLNPPPSSNVHTVFCERGGVGEERDQIRELIAEHRDRYKECKVWSRGPTLRQWIANGCMPSSDYVIAGEPVEEDDHWSELARGPVSHEMVGTMTSYGSQATVTESTATTDDGLIEVDGEVGYEFDPEDDSVPDNTVELFAVDEDDEVGESDELDDE